MKLAIKLSILLALLAGCHAKTESKEQRNASLLFVLHAKSGLYKDGKLYLKEVDQAVTYFADRPVRRAGSMKISDFLKAWDEKVPNSFEKSPPNAGFVFLENRDEKYNDYPLELRKPMLNTSQNSLTFDVKFLEGKAPIMSQEFSGVTLFIDNDRGEIGKPCSRGTTSCRGGRWVPSG